MPRTDRDAAAGARLPAIPPGVPAALAVLAGAMAVTGCHSTIVLVLVSGGVLLGTMPFWSDGHHRLSLDKAPISALFFVCLPENALLLSACTLFLSSQLLEMLQGRRYGPWRTAVESVVAPGLAFGVASVWSSSGWLAFAAIFLCMHLGGILARAAASRLPLSAIRPGPWAHSCILSMSFALLVCRSSVHGEALLTTLLVGSAAAFSVLARTRLDAQRTYMKLASETALQNSLAAELSTASSVGQYLGLLEAYLHGGRGETTILSRQESGQGWIAWMEDRQHTVSDADMPLPAMPAPGEMIPEVTLGRSAGTMLGLSRSPDMLLFVPGETGRSLAAMDATVRRNLVSLIAHSWRAVGHSIAIEEAFIAAAMMLARLADSKDDYTHGHSVRVSRLSQKIGRELELPPDMLRTLTVGALLHDLGKVAIPVEILTKRGLLTREERSIIEKHPVEGTKILGTLSGYDVVRSIVQSHHERLDGKGYPFGLSGREIPFPARIVAVADTFDAITSRRFYRENNDVRTAVDAIRAGAGTQFDSRIVAALIRVLERGELLDGAGA
ncbi:MAG TPA: HD-GYP domain-containing protein [Candidatus Fermentibacter daniensis]|nr:HD-GYP domain-containing protein [Candidatus Fermentibacter daniensis]HQH92141.1 HD-GYP domain-containing protein [Candidatus Fermentibacter daniensis]